MNVHLGVQGDNTTQSTSSTETIAPFSSHSNITKLDRTTGSVTSTFLKFPLRRSTRFHQEGKVCDMHVSDYGKANQQTDGRCPSRWSKSKEFETLERRYSSLPLILQMCSLL